MPINEYDRVKITPEIITTLKGHIKRTGVLPAILLRGRRGEFPEGLNRAHILRWLNGKVLSARKDHLDYVLKLWQSLPDESDVYYELTHEKREELRGNIDETGLSPRRLFADRDDVPEGFSWKHLYARLSRSKKIRKDHCSYIIAVCNAHRGTGYIKITQAVRDKITSEINRTGKSIPQVLRLAGKNKPDNLTAAKAGLWLNGKVGTAEKTAIDGLLALYAQYQDKKHPSKHLYRSKHDWQENSQKTMKHYKTICTSLELIAEKDMQRLQYYRKRFRLLPTKVFTLTEESPPEGLHPHIINNWLGMNTKSADPKHLKWLFKHCERLELILKQQELEQASILRKNIIEEIARTGVAYETVYGHLQELNKKPGFTLAALRQFIDGELDKIPPEKIKPVVKYYRALPKVGASRLGTKKRKGAVTSDLRFIAHKPISRDQLKQLRYYRDEFRFLPGKIFKTVQEPPPADLNPYKVSSWLSGATKTADPALVKWVLEHCKQYEKS